MRTIEERRKDLDQQIAALKRRRKELASEDKATSRKTRTRALIVLGGVVTAAAAGDGGEKFAEWLRARARHLKDKDRELLSQAFSGIFRAQPSPADDKASDGQGASNA